MSRMIRGSLVALVLATPAVLGAQNFEGRVTASIYGGRDRGPADVVILVKDGKSRLETTMGGMPMAMIMDYPGGTITTLMTPQKMYMKMSLAEAEAGMRSMTGATGNAEPPTVTRTGKKETIAGVSCEHVVFGTKEGGPQADVCTASGMGFFGGGGGMGGGRSGVPQAEQLRKEFKDGFFPLKIESIEGSNRVTRMEVKTVQRQSVDGALFTVPAGFTEMKMPMGRP